MEHESAFTGLTRLVAQDKGFSFTILSCISIVAIFINLETAQTPVIGVPATIMYFLLNSTFVGAAFFRNEKLLIKLLLGNLCLIVLLGLTGLVVMILYNLDSLRSVAVLCIVAFVASVMNKRMKSINAAN